MAWPARLGGWWTANGERRLEHHRTGPASEHRGGHRSLGEQVGIRSARCSRGARARFERQHLNSDSGRSRSVVAEGSKPPSVRPGIRLCVHTVSGLPVVWTYTGEGSPFHPFSAVMPRWVSARLSSDLGAGYRTPASERPRFGFARSRARPAHAGGGVSPPAPHRSDKGVSFLFQSQRSPAPGLRPVACPGGGGTFLMARVSTRGARGPGSLCRGVTTRAIVKGVRLLIAVIVTAVLGVRCRQTGHRASITRPAGCTARCTVRRRGGRCGRSV